jgi:hypothetical protein
MIKIDFAIKNYEISSRTKMTLEANLSKLLDLGLEGPVLEVEDHSLICQRVIEKIERNDLIFSSKEKRILTSIPAVLLERFNYDSPLPEFKRILQIINDYSSSRR